MMLLLNFTAAFSQVSFEEKLTTVSNISMTINNLGIIGNSFGGAFDLLGFSSCQYPVNSGVEHLFDGGLWVGAKIDGNVVAVSTGAVDASTGYSTGKSGFEFTAPIGSGLEESSSLFDSPVFSPFAKSHQDFVADFTDENVIVPGTSIPVSNHDNPLNIDVHFEAYNWNFSFANFFVILNFEITNSGTSILSEPYLGYWLDGVVRNVNITPPGGTSFYNKGGNGYIDTLFMAYEFDATGDPGFTDSYIALKYLGAEFNGCQTFIHPKTDTSVKLHFNSWQFQNSADPLYFFPGTDDQRYGKMIQGLNFRSDWVSAIQPALKTPNNRSTLISIGKFPDLLPGQKVNIAFAVVCARKKNDGNPNTSDTDIQKQNLEKNAFWAQAAYNGEDRNFNGILDAGEDQDGNGCITRFILPTPPDIPKVKIVAGENKAELYWTNNAESSVDPISKEKDFEGYRIYKTKIGFDVSAVQDIDAALNLAVEFDSASNGISFDAGFTGARLEEPYFFENDTTPYRYKYTFDKLQNGWQHAISVTAFDRGDEETQLESLESSRLANVFRIFPGQSGNPGFVNGNPFVYPNPYYAGAAWDGSSTFEEDKKIIFANLPSKCTVRIYTVSGDFIDELEHNESWNGNDTRWFKTYADTAETQFSGGEHAWDLLSTDGQIVARGIYLFSVEDHDSGKIRQGKFVMIR